MIDPISIALFAAKTWGPSLIGKLMGDDAENVAKEVVGMATKITGKSDPQEALSALEADPVLALQFQQSLMDYSLKVAQEDTKRLQTVNETMRAEAKSEHWMQWSWRPFNGFLFGITLFGNYVFPHFMNVLITLPADYIKPADIPEFVLMSWAAILGVTAWHRGVNKRVQSGEVKASPLSNLKSLVQRTLN